MNVARPACSRRALLGMGVAVAVVPGSMTLAAAPAANTADIGFAVWRKGERIGTHKVGFSQQGGELVARSEIDLVVRIAFIPVFRYRQSAEDRWERGNLVAARYQTDDNGTASVVQARTVDGKLLVDGPRGRVQAALGTMSDVCFWNQAIVSQRGLIDSQTGELATLDKEGAIGVERVDVAGSMVEAKHFRLAANKGRGGEVWYDSTGRLVKAVIQTRGETLDYHALA